MFLFCSCYGQNTSTLTFVNKSQLKVDSIVISKPDRVILENLPIGQQYSKSLTNILINSNRESAFPFTVYLNGKTLTGTWGFHDFGRLALKNETFYIFNNGITRTERQLEKPKNFIIYFYNASTKSVDTFFSGNNSIKKVTELSPRSFEIIYDFDNIQKSNDFSVIINGERKSSNIDHDFNNWNINQTFFYYENDSIKTGALPWREPLEFIVDIEVKLQFPSDSVKVESDAIVKNYYFNQPNYLKIVFDFKKLRQKPTFIIVAANKKYTVDLSSHDFSNIYSNQKIFFLEETGIRSLTE